MGLVTRLLDLVLAPVIAGAALPMRAVRAGSTRSLPVTFSILRRVGIFPIRAHYYEPLFDTSGLNRTGAPRELPGIDFAIGRQTELLESFARAEPADPLPASEQFSKFAMQNGNFEAGDAEIWFHVIRHFRPRRILEIGSGHSTRMARLAIASLEASDPSYGCDHVCVEPYEMPWLEQLGITVIRKKLEESDPSLVRSLGRNDILFIDSSHMIRPQGEVLQEFLEILPTLRSGVIVHVHDIFSPRDYPIEWLEIPRFWNEQYLLEAFLTHNTSWEVLLAVNMLKHARYQQLSAVCPYLDEKREPGSFYMRRL